MPIYLNLNQQISCETICKKIEHLIQKYAKSKNTLENAILSIEVKEIAQLSNMLPLIEYKESTNRCI